MRNSLTIRRWRLDIYSNAIYLQKQADPKCSRCDGTGSVNASAVEAPEDAWDGEYDTCSCWNPDRSLRIPLARRAVASEYPF